MTNFIKPILRSTALAALVLVQFGTVAPSFAQERSDIGHTKITKQANGGRIIATVGIGGKVRVVEEDADGNETSRTEVSVPDKSTGFIDNGDCPVNVLC